MNGPAGDLTGGSRPVGRGAYVAEIPASPDRPAASIPSQTHINADAAPEEARWHA
jgi:hypothetical protein